MPTQVKRIWDQLSAQQRARIIAILVEMLLGQIQRPMEAKDDGE